MHRRHLLHLISVTLIAVPACGTPATAVQPLNAPNPNAPKITLDISTDGDVIAWDVKSLEVPAGSMVTLVFKNAASKGSNMLHNWVLVKVGREDSVANDGIAAGAANSYIKPGDPNVLVFTPVIGPGENTQVTFAAPAPGRYTYTCTFPGHASLMKGTFTVK